ncbi:unnamed protein product [Mytilus edulis]|uniref:Uncharacterized protein n=1 Tax=Mytilus edulis TaxID=6550 RepID=A0A8S3SVD0_MYTED|nr:unnamed protein product [Mytilus edulis]
MERWKTGTSKEDKTHYDFVKSWWAQDEQQGYYKDFKDNDVEEIRRWNAERHENKKDFRERWTGDHTNENLKVIPLDENCYEYRTVEESFKMNNENFRIVQIFRIENKEAYELHTSFGKTVMKKLNDNTHTPINNIYGMELRERPLLTSMKMVLIEITMEKMIWTRGKDLKEPPRDINNSRYDSAVDDVNDPKIHVMFRDNQAYPEYLIQFNRARY